jgi:hypothetical protein
MDRKRERYRRKMLQTTDFGTERGDRKLFESFQDRISGKLLTQERPSL